MPLYSPWRRKGEAEAHLHWFLTTPPDGGQLSPPPPRPLCPQGKGPHYPTNCGWVGPTADLDVLGMRKRRNSKLVATLTKLFRLQYAYHSSLASKILTSSTTHKEETPGRIHQIYSNVLRKKRKFRWHFYMYGLYTATFYTLYDKVNTTFLLLANL